MTLKIGFTVLLLFNLLLIYQLKYNDEPEINYLNKNNYALEFVKEPVRNDIITAYGGIGVFGLIVINEQGCLMCTLTEIELVNNHMNELENKLVIISIGPNPDFLKLQGAQFNYLHYPSVSEVFAHPIPFTNPYSFIMDKNFAYDMNFTDTSKPHSRELRQAYYKFLSNFLTQAI